MRSKWFRFISPILLMAVWVSSRAQDYTVRAVGLEDGLSQSSINAITQDDKGFLWFATQDGLNRYDGYTFQVLKNEPFDPTSLSHNHITALHTDKNGILWVGTTGGLNVYNPHTLSFRRFYADSRNPRSLSANFISCIFESPDGQIWVGTNNGLNRVVIDGRHPLRDSIGFERYLFDHAYPKMTTQTHIMCLFALQDTLWVGTRDGVALLPLKQTPTQPIFPKNFVKPEGKMFTLKSIGADATGALYLCTNQGNYRRDVSGGTFQSHVFLSDKKQADLIVHKFFCDRSGNILLATEGQGTIFYRYNPREKNYDPQPVFIAGSSSTESWVFDIIEDKLAPGTYWAGTAVGGIRHIQKNTRRFLSNIGLPENSRTFVRSVFQDREGIVWMGLEFGLMSHDEKQQKTLIYPGNNPTGDLKNDMIHTFLQDRSGRLWMGTGNGLNEIIKNKNQTTFREVPQPVECPQELVFSMYEQPDGKILMGTAGSLMLFDPVTESFAGCPVKMDSFFDGTPHVYPSDMLLDKKGRLWVSSFQGLLRMEEPEKLFIPGETQPRVQVFQHNPEDINSLRNQTISGLAEDDSGHIWLGTMNGLIRVEEKNQTLTFQAFTEKEGLANNVIYALAYNRKTRSLWMSTNRGLTRFNPYTFHVDNYDRRDGLQDNEFNQCAIGKSPDGALIFGGLRGYTRFLPEEIRQDTTPPAIWLTRFSGGDGQIRDLLNKDDLPIRLKYTENTFSLDFIGLNYKHTEKNTYAYRLTEKDNEDEVKWLFTGNTRQANITNLPPGDYIFQVKAANSDGIWSPRTADLRIVISPPFWQTAWFYLLMAGILGGLFFAFHRYRVGVKVQRVMELERVRKNTAADFHDELGHKLTIISLFGEILKKQSDGVSEKTLPHLNKIISTSNSLYYSMKDLLWVLDPEKDSLLDMVLLLKDFGDELFDKTGVAFVTEGIRDDMAEKILPMEMKRHIVLIFKEMMNNSLKHSHCRKAVLSLKYEPRQSFVLTFTDDGQGFDLAHAAQGHGLTNVRDRAAKIGARLALDSSQKGTTVTLEV
ncbi:MAG: two-component regulator propeller domain-containing protein [Bacteroidia bacterium]|nr:two-component regulator propeller domain-containing protein [Bacteroidia bacterium]